MKITEQKLREAIRNGINKLNEAKSYDLDLENAREYEGVIGDAIKKLEGIDAYHKMAEDGGGTAVNSTASMIYISQYGKTDNTDELKKILKKTDSNLDVNKIKNNFDATDYERSKHDQDKDIWKYNIPKKIDYHKAKKMGILTEPNVTQMDHEVVGELLNMLAAYTSEGNPLANIAWRDLDSFMAAAHDYVRGSDWKEFKKDVKTKYPVLEKRWNSDMMELSKIETWVRKSGMDYDDWEWDGKELTIFLKKGNPEKYSKEDLEEEGVFESKLTEGAMSDIHIMAKEAKDENDFIKKFFKAYGDKVNDNSAGKQWAKELYNDVVNESKLNENAILTFSNELNDEGIVAGIFDGVGDGKTVKAQFTKKKWDDGVPVTKFFTRGGYKDIKTPKGKFQLIETPHFWYYEINKGWAAVNKEDYGTPPFEY